MVRFINKALKSHDYGGNEKISDLLDIDCFCQITELFVFHTRNFANYSNEKLTHLFQKLTIQQGITRPADFQSSFHMDHTRIKGLFLTIEIILESFYKVKSSYPEYFNDFVADLNDLFLIHKTPLQIRYIPEKEEFYVEKVISEEVSKRVGETLEFFSSEEKVFEDFKEAIKKYSGGNYEGSIESCCVAIEDYLCIILDEKTCPGAGKFYKRVAKALKIPQDLDEKFSALIGFIQKYRAPQNHGSKEKQEFDELDLINEVIIGFTMDILTYLKKKNETKK
ncbi:MAG: hypothetical protein KC506_03640 [Nanoarchaeota archaeon]|nr:hypothetical protein [Nanoarchaeota archaeon]